MSPKIPIQGIQKYYGFFLLTVGKKQNIFFKRSKFNFFQCYSKNRKYLFMVRLILFLVLILFIIWILRPFLKKKNGDEKNNKLENIMNSDKSTFRQPNTIFIVISVVLLFALFLWLLPKLGINFLSLFQKIIPLISTLRGILPF